MSIFEDTNPKSLKELLGQIDRREAVLPDFQRDFVWEPNATEELIVSIMQNYPAGSLLRIRNVQNMFAIRQFEGAEPLQPGQPPTFLVLDGQQRLTSLYQAFYGKGNYRYYLDIRKLMTKQILSDSIFYVKSKEAANYDDLDYQVREMILPLSVLKNGLGGFNSWTRQLGRRFSDPQERTQFEDSLSEAVEPLVQTVDDYAFPVVTLSDKTGAEAVCNIFETLNRTGVKLSPFELLVARFYPKKVYLRDLWDKAIQDYQIIEDFDIDPYYILLAITLSAYRTPSAKRGDVLDLKSDTVNDWWEPAVKGMATALEILRDDCGVINPAWLPYNTIVYTMAAVLAKNPFPQGPAAGAMRKKLIRWFWCSVFSQTYESSPTSQAATDVTQLLVWLEGGEVPESVANFERKFRPNSLRETTSRQRAVYRGVIALLLSRRVYDIHTSQQITAKTMLSEKMDAYRIFPVGYLRSIGIKGDQADNVLNRTVISIGTSHWIGSKRPSNYFYDVELHLRQVAPQFYDEVLESHLLPTGDDSPLKTDDYEAFLGWRLNAIWAEIQAVTLDTATGATVPVFPQVKQIVSASLRQSVETAIQKFNEDNVHNGLQELGVMFEGTLKSYMVARYTKDAASLGGAQDPVNSNLTLANMINQYCAYYDKTADKAELNFLRELRNQSSHPNQVSYVPTLEKRRKMLKTVQFTAGMFIDYIKLFDEQKAQL